MSLPGTSAGDLSETSASVLCHRAPIVVVFQTHNSALYGMPTFFFISTLDPVHKKVTASHWPSPLKTKSACNLSINQVDSGRCGDRKGPWNALTTLPLAVSHNRTTTCSLSTTGLASNFWSGLNAATRPSPPSSKGNSFLA